MKVPTFQEQYERLAHAVQSGVAMLMNYRQTLTEPKHLRTGLDLRACDHHALVTLLLDKGIITQAEYEKALLQSMEQEVQRSTAEINALLATPGNPHPNVRLV